MSYDLVYSLGKKVLDGGSLTLDEAMSLTELKGADIPLLLAVANKVRDQFTGTAVDTCQIVNARSGGCSENCKFCAQSGYHEVKLEVYPLLSEDEIVAAAKQAEAAGAYRFCIVTAGRGMESDADFEKILRAIRRIGQETKLNRCCSLGTLSEENVAKLKEAGITRYHHNLETSQNNFSNICTTHTFDERIATIKKVKAAGLQSCSGGIIGLGETWRDRVELAFTLKELGVDSVPLNVLNAVPGTALEGQAKVPPMEILQSFAIFRMILPDKILRYAGGKETGLGDLVPLGYLSGLNGTMIGNYLTTQGMKASEDLHTVTELGLQPLCAAKA